MTHGMYGTGVAFIESRNSQDSDSEVLKPRCRRTQGLRRAEPTLKDIMANRFLSLVTAAGLVLAAVACDSGSAAPSAPNPNPVNFVGSTTNPSPLVVAGRTVVTNGSTRVLDLLNNPIALRSSWRTRSTPWTPPSWTCDCRFFRGPDIGNAMRG